ncbi:unnamed protein product [Lampetra planeri]
MNEWTVAVTRCSVEEFHGERRRLRRLSLATPMGSRSPLTWLAALLLMPLLLVGGGIWQLREQRERSNKTSGGSAGEGDDDAQSRGHGDPVGCSCRVEPYRVVSCRATSQRCPWGNVALLCSLVGPLLVDSDDANGSRTLVISRVFSSVD